MSVHVTSLHILSWCQNVTLRSSSYYSGVGTWHPIHILSWCRNVALWSIYYPSAGTWHSDPYTILVPEHDTRSIYYPGVGTWHSDPLIYYPGTRTWHPIHILSWCWNVTLRSLYTILVPKRGIRSIYYPGVGTWHSDPHILSRYRNVAPDPLISLLSFIKPSFIPRHHH